MLNAILNIKLYANVNGRRQINFINHFGAGNHWTNYQCKPKSDREILHSFIRI